MMTTTSILLVVVLLATVSQSDESQVVLQSSQEVIHPILTKTLRLRCSIQTNNNPLLLQKIDPNRRSLFEDTTYRTATSTRHTTYPSSTTTRNLFMNTPSTTIIPITTREPSTFKTESTTKGVVSENGVAHVTAIIITKENKWTGLRDRVASVTPFDAAVDESPSPGHFQVEGSSERSPVVGEQGYLQVTWTRPLEDQAGVYYCEVFALNMDKHPISLWTSVQITSSEPSISDLVTYISDHDKQITELVEENRSLKNDILLITMNETMNETRLHTIQTGHVTSCSNNPHQVYFPQQFNSIPRIFTSVPFLKHTSSSLGTYNINVQSITQSSFYISCGTTYMDIYVDWMAFD